MCEIPRICIAYDICKVGRSHADAAPELDRRIVTMLMMEWINRGLIKKLGKGKYEYSGLCKAYEKYQDCVLSCLANPYTNSELAAFACISACIEEAGL